MSIITERRDWVRASIDRAVGASFAAEECRDPLVRRSWERMLHHVRSRTNHLQLVPVGGKADPRPQTEIVGALRALASHGRSWLRPVEARRPDGEGPRRLLASLARYILSDYPIPDFMSSAWYRGHATETEVRRRQGWYIHLGRGGSIRTADLPLPLTKRMAHHFMHAYDHFAIDEAIRWSQVRGLGGSDRLAGAITSTRLGRSFGEEEFWATVIRFFIRHPTIDLVHVSPIVDYLHHQRFVPQEAFDDRDAIVELAPPQPRLTMARRKPSTLLREVDAWHRQQRHDPSPAAVRWPRSGLREFQTDDTETKSDQRTGWTIQELLSNGELRREGEVMRHCVAHYVKACVLGYSSIWSMRFDDGEQWHRVMTIEVDLAAKTICQARRRGNAPPNPKARRVMERWADQEGLTIAEYV